MKAPAIAGVKLNSGKLTVSGTGFYDIPADYSLTTKLHPPSGADVTAKPTSSSTTQISLDLPSDAKAAGCWQMVVAVGTLTAPQSDKSEFAIAPSPQMDTAKRQAPQIIVAGKDFVDTSSCGGDALSFQLVQQGKAPVAATIKKIDSAQQVTLDLPDAAKEGSWTVQVLLGKDVQGKPVTLQ